MSSPISRRLTRVAVLAVALVLSVPALASADAPDVTSARGFATENSPSPGDVTVRVEGTWAWNTHNSDCNTNRSGIGIAIDWNDSTAAGNHVTTLGVNSIDVGTPTDNVAHPAEPKFFAANPALGDIASPASFADWRGGCGVRSVHPNAGDNNLAGNPITLAPGNYPAGTFGCTPATGGCGGGYPTPTGDYLGGTKGLFHVYTAAAIAANGGKLPDICALTYDVHGKDSNTVPTGGAPNNAKEVTAGAANHNGDNSAEKNASTFKGNTCFTIALKNHPTIPTHAVGGSSPAAPATLQDRATLTGATANAGGTITFELFKNDNTCAAASKVALGGGDGSFESDGTTAKAVDGSLVNQDYYSSKVTGAAAGDTYYWVAHYSGDANNDPADSPCADADETVAPGANLPTVVTVASGDIFTGISDKATISGLVAPGGTFGTIDFDVYLDDATCSVAAQQIGTTESVAVTGNGDYFSTVIALTTAGTYYYKANYNPTGGGGTDVNNSATNNTCHPVPDNESLVVDVAPVTLTTTATAAVQTGSPISDAADLSGITADAGGTITFTLFKDDNTCQPASQVAMPANVVTVTGPTTHYVSASFTPGTAGTYYWVAVYSGDPKNSVATAPCNDAGEVSTVSDPPPPPGNPPGPPPVLNPQIHIEKTGPAQAQAGGTIAYLLDVSNTGNVSFNEANVVVTDSLCSASPVLISPGGKKLGDFTTDDPTPGTFDVGDHWFYTCSVQTAPGQTVVNNVAVATGTVTGPNGDITATVQDDDPADTVLIQPQIAVEPLLPGSARLRGPAGCLAGGPHKMVLTGRRISKVVYLLDGKKVKTVTKADKLGRFTYTVNRKNLRAGVHTIVARVTYLPNTSGGTKTFRRTFAKCAKALKPEFTG